MTVEEAERVIRLALDWGEVRIAKHDLSIKASSEEVKHLARWVAKTDAQQGYRRYEELSADSPGGTEGVGCACGWPLDSCNPKLLEGDAKCDKARCYPPKGGGVVPTNIVIQEGCTCSSPRCAVHGPVPVHYALPPGGAWGGGLGGGGGMLA